MNRFRIAITLVEATKVALAALLGAAATQPPLYPVPGVVILLCVVAIAFLGVVSAQMPSWADSPRASVAVKNVEGGSD